MNQDIEIDDLIKDIKETPKVGKIKWVCPLCDGGHLFKPKELINKENLKTEVTSSQGELFVVITKDDDIIGKVKYPIKYCPVCGKKLKSRRKS